MSCEAAQAARVTLHSEHSQQVSLRDGDSLAANERRVTSKLGVRKWFVLARRTKFISSAVGIDL